MQQHLLIYTTYNNNFGTFFVSVFLHTVLYFMKNDFLLRILRFPGYFETPLFQTFFHFPWDFANRGVQLHIQPGPEKPGKQHIKLHKTGMYDHCDHWRKNGYDHWRLVYI